MKHEYSILEIVLIPSIYRVSVCGQYFLDITFSILTLNFNQVALKRQNKFGKAK
jgi:hypothetical protein